MTEYPELAVDPAGRSYDEMVATLKKTVFYPVQLCPNCGRSYVDFEYLKKYLNPCPYCGGI